MSLTDLRHGFRDEKQRRRAQGVVMLRLADDREQEACRTLMKFRRQLAMTYTEVTEPELRQHLSAEKWDVIQELIGAIGCSPTAVDAWIEAACLRFPVVQGRGYQAWRSETDI